MDTTETLLGRKPAFVLVPGSWCGAWCWKPVADRLRNAGHTVFPMSLTGLAERSHLLSDRITLETHVMDVVNLIKYNGLRDVVLVVHKLALAVADELIVKRRIAARAGFQRVEEIVDNFIERQLVVNIHTVGVPKRFSCGSLPLQK